MVLVKAKRIVYKIQIKRITLLKREDLTVICQKILPFLLLLKEQQIFHSSSPLETQNDFTFVAQERNIE